MLGDAQLALSSGLRPAACYYCFTFPAWAEAAEPETLGVTRYDIDRAISVRQELVLMIAALSLILALNSAPVPTDDPFHSAATTAICQLIHTQLWGHYDLEFVSLIATDDRQSHGDGTLQDYEVCRVTARFRAIRNTYWNPHLNPDLPEHLRDSSIQLYLPFRPRGYEFAGTLDVDIANTLDGWRILNRHHHSMIEFPLARYLHCQPDPQNPDHDLAIIQACFGVPPTPRCSGQYRGIRPGIAAELIRR